MRSVFAALRIGYDALHEGEKKTMTIRLYSAVAAIALFAAKPALAGYVNQSFSQPGSACEFKMMNTGYRYLSSGQGYFGGFLVNYSGGDLLSSCPVNMPNYFPNSPTVTINATHFGTGACYLLTDSLDANGWH